MNDYVLTLTYASLAISCESKSNKENSCEAMYTVTREKKAPHLGHDGGMKPIEIDVSIGILAIMLQDHKVCGEGLIKVDLLKQGLQATKVGLKIEIASLEGKKELKDLYHTIDVHLVGIHHLKGFFGGSSLD